jgi:hypothetical protein
MSDFKFLSIDTWWKAVLALGVLATIGASIFDFTFIDRRHLFGLGIGMILIGIGHWMAYKDFSTFAFHGILSWKAMKHNPISIILILIGIGLIGLFGYLIVKGLI